MASGFMTLLLVLLAGGGGNDLLDYLPTEAYWKAKGVEITVERMTAELVTGEPANAEALVRQLGADDFAVREAATVKLRQLGPAAVPALKRAAESDDPEVKIRARKLLQAAQAAGGEGKAVRRLMALRALGELGKPEALPALRRLAAAKEPFVADYARQAAAAIEGKPYQRPGATREQLWQDVCLLPAGCAVVAQVTMPGGGPVNFAQALEQVKDKIPGGQDPQMMLGQLAQMLTIAAERVGNIRLLGVTVGVAGDIGDQGGFVVVVGRGLYDPKAVAATLQQAGGCEPVAVGGLATYSPEDEVALIPCSPERFILVAGPRREGLPLQQVAQGVKAGRKQLALDPAMKQLIREADTTAPMWAVVRMTEQYRTVGLFAPFDTVTATGKQQGEAIALQVVARGTNEEAVQGAVAEFKTGLQKARQEIGQAAAQMPAAKPVADFINSVQVERKGTTATLTGTLKGQAGMMLMPAMMWMGVARSAPVPAPMEARPVPAPQ